MALAELASTQRRNILPISSSMTLPPITASSRTDVAAQVDKLADDGIMRVGDEYRIQTEEGHNRTTSSVSARQSSRTIRLLMRSATNSLPPMYRRSSIRSNPRSVRAQPSVAQLRAVAFSRIHLPRTAHHRSGCAINSRRLRRSSLTRWKQPASTAPCSPFLFRGSLATNCST